MKYGLASLAFAAFAVAPALADQPAVGAEDAPAAIIPLTEAESGLPESPWFKSFVTEDSELTTAMTPSTTAPIEEDAFGFSWNGSERWGLKIDVTRRSENPVLPEEEITAGAYYHVTPRFRFGGGVSFSSGEVTEAPIWKEENGKAAVRIESAFSF